MGIDYIPMAVVGVVVDIPSHRETVEVKRFDRRTGEPRNEVDYVWTHTFNGKVYGEDSKSVEALEKDISDYYGGLKLHYYTNDLTFDRVVVGIKLPAPAAMWQIRDAFMEVESALHLRAMQSMVAMHSFVHVSA